MRKWFEIGGIVAAVVLVAFGIVAVVMGFNGRSTVQHSLKLEQIVGSEDMTPAAIKKAATDAGLKNFDVPTLAVAGKAINSGERARAFAGYMRIHTLESTQGYTYSQMGRYQALSTAPKSELAEGGGTDNATYAVMDAKTAQPVANGARDLWVTETALTTALNTSFFAERVAMFSMTVGFALLLTGIGFLVLAYLGVLRRKEAEAAATKPTAIPAA